MTLKNYTIIWRLDGDFIFTDVEIDTSQIGNLSSNDFVAAAIRADNAEDWSDEDIDEMVKSAINEGYELLAVFHAPYIEYLF